jgi:hypothetical protein
VFVVFWQKNISLKAARKILVKLIQDPRSETDGESELSILKTILKPTRMNVRRMPAFCRFFGFKFIDTILSERVLKFF